MSKARVVLFSLVLSAVCAGLLGVSRSMTARHIERNERLDEMRSVLDAADWRPPGGKTIMEVAPAKVEEVFSKRVRPVAGMDGEPLSPDAFEKGKLVKLFSYADESGKVVAHVVRIKGKGLWGDIFGFLAVNPELRPDGKVLLRGITFYKEDETPGLGKRINEMKFRGQFRADQGRLAPGLRILKGEGNETGPDSVDGITSATVTSVGVEGMIEDGARWYVSWRKSHPQGAKR